MRKQRTPHLTLQGGLCCVLLCFVGPQREIRLREREQSLTAERAALLEQQSIHAARDEALETLQLKYHLSVCKIKE